MSNVKLISLTQPTLELRASGPEDIVSYCARVSNPANQENYNTSEKLLRYCIKNSHWSVFEMADATLEITTSRTIARQLLRHRSFSFQEFSQRYSSEVSFVEPLEARSQDYFNRQNSIEDLEGTPTEEYFREAQQEIIELAKKHYTKLISLGVAKECARAILPEGLTESTLYMKGSLRSWITYLQVRLDKSTQKEHREVAQHIYDTLKVPFKISLKDFTNDLF